MVYEEHRLTDGCMSVRPDEIWDQGVFVQSVNLRKWGEAEEPRGRVYQYEEAGNNLDGDAQKHHDKVFAGASYHRAFERGVGRLTVD